MVSDRNGLSKDLAHFPLPKGLLYAAGVENDEDFDDIPEEDSSVDKSEHVEERER